MAIDPNPPPGGLESPAAYAFAVTPNDGADLPTLTRSLYVGGSGNLNVLLVGDSSPVVFTNVQAGYHPLRVRRVYATSTTATNILGLV